MFMTNVKVNLVMGSDRVELGEGALCKELLPSVNHGREVLKALILIKAAVCRIKWRTNNFPNQCSLNVDVITFFKNLNFLFR